MSEEHKILGFRPPHGSFAAEVQSVASKHPEGRPGIDTTRLREIAREDALRILAERKTSADSAPVSPTAAAKVVQAAGGGAGAAGAEAKHIASTALSTAPRSPGINLNTINASPSAPSSLSCLTCTCTDVGFGTSSYWQRTRGS